MKQPKFGPLFLALFLFFGMLLIPLCFLTPLVSEQKVEDATTSLKKEMFQGIVLQQKNANGSEISSYVWLIRVFTFRCVPPLKLF